MQQHWRDLVSPVFERRNQIGQITLVGFGFAVGGFRAQNPRDRRVDHVEQDQLALTILGLGQAQGTVEDLGVGLVVLERDADSCPAGAAAAPPPSRASRSAGAARPAKRARSA